MRNLRSSLLYGPVTDEYGTTFWLIPNASCTSSLIHPLGKRRITLRTRSSLFSWSACALANLEVSGTTLLTEVSPACTRDRRAPKHAAETRHLARLDR